jgi:hypothetical protein
MPLWNNNDREESKPSWLNKISKRLCVRTIRGWEMPLMGSFFDYGATGYTTNNGNNTQGAVYTELLVTMPINDSSSAAYTARGNSGSSTWGQGVTVGSDTPNFAPYFTCPFGSDSVTAGGVDGLGVSHNNITFLPVGGGSWGGGLTPGAMGAVGGGGIQYGVNMYGVSSLGGLTGVTAYIKVCANDSNFTNTLTLGLSGTQTGFSLYTGPVDLNDSTKVPATVFNTFFGATSTNDKVSAYRYDNIGVLVAAGSTANGAKVISLKVNDGPTGTTAYTVFKLQFDRAAGLTTGGATAGGVNAPTIAQYYWSTTSSF